LVKKILILEELEVNEDEWFPSSSLNQKKEDSHLGEQRSSMVHCKV